MGEVMGHPRFRQLIPGLLLALALAHSPLFAEDGVTIKTTRSKVEVKRVRAPDRWFTARPGSVLKAGDIIRTAVGARAELVMQDGTRLLLTGASRLNVQQFSPNRILNLASGRLKSFVRKMKRDSRFEVRTPLAAASVRGTVFEVAFDEDKQAGSVAVDEGVVALAKDGKEVLLERGDRMDFFADRPLEERPAPGAPGSAESRESLRREVGLGMSKEQVMAAAAEEMRLAEYQEGKTLIDVNGQRVRLEEYVIRRPKEVLAVDQDKAFKLVVLNERADRFDYFYYRGIFNTSLPTDLSVALNDVRGKLNLAPNYYLTAYETGQSNTQDSILDSAGGGHLVRVDFDGSNYTLTDTADPTQTRTIAADQQSVVAGETFHKIYDPVGDRFVTLTQAQYDAGGANGAVYDASTDQFRALASGDTYFRTGFNSYSHSLNSVVKQAYVPSAGVTNVLSRTLDIDTTYVPGSPLNERSLVAVTETPSGSDLLHNRVTLFYGDGTTETYDTYIISDDGKIGPLDAFASLSTGTEFKSELLKWNYQQTVTATEFQGRKIDLVVEPKILIKSGLIP
jgi:hypothetical protein